MGVLGTAGDVWGLGRGWCRLGVRCCVVLVGWVGLVLAIARQQVEISGLDYFRQASGAAVRFEASFPGDLQSRIVPEPGGRSFRGANRPEASMTRGGSLRYRVLFPVGLHYAVGSVSSHVSPPHEPYGRGKG